MMMKMKMWIGQALAQAKYGLWARTPSGKKRAQRRLQEDIEACMLQDFMELGVTEDKAKEFIKSLLDK